MTPQQAVRICSDMPIAMAAIDVDSNFLWVNNFFCSMLGRTEGEVLEERCYNLIFEEDIDIDKKLREQLIKGDITSYSIIKAYKQKGDRPDSRRLVYGTFTAWRYPASGTLECIIIFFVPHRNESSGPRATVAGAAGWIRENWKWIIAMISTCATLTTGNYAATWDALRKAQDLESQVQSLQDRLEQPALSQPQESPLPSSEKQIPESNAPNQ
jgi:hypothetical protein